MKKYYFLSLFLHILPLILMALLRPDLMELSLTQAQEKGLEGQTSGHDVQVIEIVEGTEKSKSKVDEKRFYWGVGVTVNNELREMPGMLELPTQEITTIYTGYCAESSGMQVGDIVYLINGLPLDYNNQLDGEGPKKMVLTILRKGTIVTITVDRCKVYY